MITTTLQLIKQTHCHRFVEEEKLHIVFFSFFFFLTYIFYAKNQSYLFSFFFFFYTNIHWHVKMKSYSTHYITESIRGEKRGILRNEIQWILITFLGASLSPEAYIIRSFHQVVPSSSIAPPWPPDYSLV